MGIYTASFWTKITSSATIPVFDENVYTLKATIDDTGHQDPGSPYAYPINLTQGQNLYIVFTAPSGSTIIQNLCLSSSFTDFGGGYNEVKIHLRSGSCAASGSFTNSLGADIDVYYTVIDNQNNYYYEGPIIIAPGSASGSEFVQLNGDNTISSITIEINTNPNLNYNVQPCGACGIPDYVSFAEQYAVVQPASVTSSIFNAQIINISSSNYGIKVSASVDGLLSNVDTEISWSIFGDLPIYYVGGFGDVYYSTEISDIVQRNNCPSGEVGSYVTYTLAASHSSSPISQVAAQNSASAYFNSTSQSYANTYGTCSPTGSAAITVEIYGQYNGTDAEIEYRVNAGSWNYVGYTANTNCDNLALVGGLAEADSIEIQCVNNIGVISGTDTGTCPASASGCAYQYTVGPNLLQSLYVTVNRAVSC